MQFSIRGALALQLWAGVLVWWFGPASVPESLHIIQYVDLQSSRLDVVDQVDGRLRMRVTNRGCEAVSTTPGGFTWCYEPVVRGLGSIVIFPESLYAPYYEREFLVSPNAYCCSMTWIEARLLDFMAGLALVLSLVWYFQIFPFKRQIVRPAALPEPPPASENAQ